MAPGENCALAIEIRELRPNDREAITALWSTVTDDGLDWPEVQQLLRHQIGLSVAAHEEGNIVGMVLCARVDRGYQHWVAVAHSHRDTPIVKKMVDKALLKYLAHGQTRCHINLPDGSEQSGEFWDFVKWRPETGAEDAAAIGRPEASNVGTEDSSAH